MGYQSTSMKIFVNYIAGMVMLAFFLVSCGGSQGIEIAYLDNRTPMEFESSIEVYPYNNFDLRDKIISVADKFYFGQKSSEIISILSEPDIRFLAVSGFQGK